VRPVRAWFLVHSRSCPRRILGRARPRKKRESPNGATTGIRRHLALKAQGSRGSGPLGRATACPNAPRHPSLEPDGHRIQPAGGIRRIVTTLNTSWSFSADASAYTGLHRADAAVARQVLVEAMLPLHRVCRRQRQFMVCNARQEAAHFEEEAARFPLFDESSTEDCFAALTHGGGGPTKSSLTGAHRIIHETDAFDA